MPKRTKGRGLVSRENNGAPLEKKCICATCRRPFEAREAREARKARKARKARRKSKASEASEAREARASSDDDGEESEDDVPILELVRRGDTEWRAPGSGKVYEIHKIVDWKISTSPLRSIFFLVWWKGYALSESTWEPATGIHPVEQVRFFKSVGVFD